MKEHKMTDEKLLLQCVEGNEDACSELVDRFKGRIWRLAYNVVRDEQAALDLSQEVFIKMYTSAKGFKGKSSAYTWLYRICMNTCLQHIRKRSRRAFENLDTPAARAHLRDDDNPSRIMERKELKGAIDAAVVELPPRQRAVFALKNYEGLSYLEISEILRISQGAVRAHYHGAIMKLRQLLKQIKREER